MYPILSDFEAGGTGSLEDENQFFPHPQSYSGTPGVQKEWLNIPEPWSVRSDSRREKSPELRGDGRARKNC